MQAPVRMEKVVINGVPSDCISVHDRGLQYGDGLFETIALIDGVPQHWDLHLRRLQRGCERIRVFFPGDAQLQEDFRALDAHPGRQVLKMLITRGAGGRGYRPSGESAPTRVLYLAPWPRHPAEYAQHGVTVRLCAMRLGFNPALAGIKHLNRLEQVLARGEWDDPEIAEGLMFDEADNVIEGTMSNVFMVYRDVLHTPSLVRCGVEGVMRGIVMKHCRAAGMPLVERVVPAVELWNADELFLTNSLIGIWPVRRLIDTARQRQFDQPRIAPALQAALLLAVPNHA